MHSQSGTHRKKKYLVMCTCMDLALGKARASIQQHIVNKTYFLQRQIRFLARLGLLASGGREGEEVSESEVFQEDERSSYTTHMHTELSQMPPAEAEPKFIGRKLFDGDSKVEWVCMGWKRICVRMAS